MSNDKKQYKTWLFRYMGCTVRWGYEPLRLGILEGFDSRFGWQVFNVSGSIAPYHYVRDELLKPILRPLSSINCDEAIELCRLICPAPFATYDGWEMHREWDGLHPIEHEYANVYSEKCSTSFKINLATGKVDVIFDSPFKEMVRDYYRDWYYKKFFSVPMFELEGKSPLELELAIDSTKGEKIYT